MKRDRQRHKRVNTHQKNTIRNIKRGPSRVLVVVVEEEEQEERER